MHDGKINEKEKRNVQWEKPNDNEKGDSLSFDKSPLSQIFYITIDGVIARVREQSIIPL